jgi:hypothetical protein
VPCLSTAKPPQSPVDGLRFSAYSLSSHLQQLVDKGLATGGAFPADEILGASVSEYGEKRKPSDEVDGSYSFASSEAEAVRSPFSTLFVPYPIRYALRFYLALEPVAHLVPTYAGGPTGGNRGDVHVEHVS